MKVSARVGVNPVPVYLFKLEVLWGWGVARQITPLPLPILFIQWLVYPALSLCPAGLCSGRNGEVTARYFPFPVPVPFTLPFTFTFPFPFPSYAHLCLTPLCLSAPPYYLPRPCLFLGFSLPCLLLIMSSLGRTLAN